MSPDEIKTILDAHARWARGEADGKDADLQGADLRGADLRGADLRGADLRGADLRDADLRGADLQNADLRGADLQDADLQGANLTGAYLQGADLRGANLTGAELMGADLTGATVMESTLIARDIRYGDLLAVLPDLFRAGGKPLEQVVTREHLTCHSWTNCPIAVAFDADHGIDAVPLAWRTWASLFVWAFDSGLLGPERIAKACGVEPEGAS